MQDLETLQPLIEARDWPKAERLLRRAADAKGAPPQVHHNLAKVLEAQGKPLSQRRTWLKRALSLDAAYARAWLELGRLEIEAEAWQPACAALEKAVALAPNDQDARRLFARVALRLGLWAEVLEAAASMPGDTEAKVLAYRARTELGEPTLGALCDLIAAPATRQTAIAVMTRTAKGRIPRRLPI
ncbi:MAG: hypothetical protein AAFY59_03430 [Pseudomonadota bacterium]